MALRHDMRNAAGGIMAAPLCIFTPEAGGMNDDEDVPEPRHRLDAGARPRA